MHLPSPPPPRIAAVEPPYAESVARDFQQVMRGAAPLNIFRVTARNPRVLSRMVAGGLLDRGSISLRERELVILRTCALCRAEYEWGVHAAAFAAKAGFSAEQLSATVHEPADSTAWSANEQLLVRLCDALHAHSDVDDHLWSDLRRFYGEDQLIELLMLAGLYHAVAYVVNGARVELESGAPRFGR